MVKKKVSKKKSSKKKVSYNNKTIVIGVIVLVILFVLAFTYQGSRDDEGLGTIFWLSDDDNGVDEMGGGDDYYMDDDDELEEIPDRNDEIPYFLWEHYGDDYDSYDFVNVEMMKSLKHLYTTAQRGPGGGMGILGDESTVFLTALLSNQDEDGLLLKDINDLRVLFQKNHPDYDKLTRTELGNEIYRILINRYSGNDEEDDYKLVKEPICGDGILDTGEECDDGNTLSGDGCSAECKIEVEPEPTCESPSTWCYAKKPDAKACCPKGSVCGRYKDYSVFCYPENEKFCKPPNRYKDCGTEALCCKEGSVPKCFRILGRGYGACEKKCPTDTGSVSERCGSYDCCKPTLCVPAPYGEKMCTVKTADCPGQVVCSGLVLGKPKSICCDKGTCLGSTTGPASCTNYYDFWEGEEDETTLKEMPAP